MLFGSTSRSFGTISIFPSVPITTYRIMHILRKVVQGADAGYKAQHYRVRDFQGVHSKGNAEKYCNGKSLTSLISLTRFRSPAATLSKFNLSEEFVDQPFELVGVVLERKAPAYCCTHQRLDDGPIVEHDVADSLVEERV